jgi:uncharacterized protein YecE (DUF72 family)
MTRVWLGTSGYSYQDWVGTFYPPGTKSGQMLALYSKAFPLVELNFTFYRVPTAAVLARMAEQTPGTFQFVVKLPRLLSHVRDRAVIDPVRDAVSPLQERGRLLGLLCQFPETFHLGEPQQRWLETLGRAFKGLSLAVEFRHESWNRDDILPWLTDHDITPVSPDVPDITGLFPRQLWLAGRRAYIRFHSRNQSWRTSSRGRYDYRFSREELTEWLRALKPHLEQLDDILFVFNNCYDGQAIDNAAQLHELLRASRARVDIVLPMPQLTGTALDHR